MTTPSLTLLLPSFDLPDDGWPDMPALQTLLSKGEREAITETFATTLCAHFGLFAVKGSELPLAALSALGDGLAAGEGGWLQADPVHLVADRDQLYLSASTALQLSQTEADSLVGELNRLYADDGWQFIAATPQRWYLHLPQSVVMTTTPTAEAMGRSVGEVLPQGEEAMVWQRVMTEVQMLLHSSPVNDARAGQGKLAVNGLWFWGGGVLPQAAGDGEWQQVFTNHPLARGLAKWHGVKFESPSLRQLSACDGRVLWVGDSLPSKQQDTMAFEALEQQLFVPLLTMLQHAELSQLVIELPGQGRWRVDRRALCGWRGRWWRRRKPLASLLKGV